MKGEGRRAGLLNFLSLDATRRDLCSRADHLDELALASGKRDINSKIIPYSY